MGSRRKSAPADELTPLERLFVAEYQKDLSATAAYARAGGSAKTAHSAGPRMLQVPRVKAAVEKALERQVALADVEAIDVLSELRRLALVDVGEAFDDEGALKALKDIPPDVRRAIASIEVEQLESDDGPRGTVRKVKFWDKRGSLELLGKYLKLWTDKVQLATSDPDAAKLSLEELRRLAK